MSLGPLAALAAVALIFGCIALHAPPGSPVCLSAIVIGLAYLCAAFPVLASGSRRL
jgi:hypothetical protein